MADAQSIQIIDAVVTSLNNATFNLAFTSVRRYIPIFDREDLETIKVSVMPAASAHTRRSRSPVWDEVYDIQVGVQLKADPTDNAIIDPIMQLTDEIIDHLKGAGAMNGATLVAAEGTDPSFVDVQLETLHIFTSVSTFSYRVLRKH